MAVGSYRDIPKDRVLECSATPGFKGWKQFFAKGETRKTGKTDMKEYLSLGAGVDSTALMLLLLDEGRNFETVFIDHGGDYPETYEYVDYLKGNGYKITVLKPSVIAKEIRYDNIYDYFWHYKGIPLRAYRICTDKFKIKPFNKYVEKPCTIYLGYDFGEINRARRPMTRVRKGVYYSYPLIDRRLTRKQCKKVIADHGLVVPPKSGCWFCPFQTMREWKRLRAKYPELFKKAMALEERAFSARGKMGFLREGKLSRLWQDNRLTDHPEFTKEAIAE